MQPTESGHRDNLVVAHRRRCHSSAIGRVLPQPEMSPVFVIIAEVFFQQSSQMSLVRNDHMGEQLPTHTPNPTLGHAVLTGCTPFCLTVRTTSAENFASRSKIKNR